MKELKTVEESMVEQVHLLMPAHINGSKSGYLLRGSFGNTKTD